MIARPKISRNERKTTEIGASKVGNFAPFSGPGEAEPLRVAPADVRVLGLAPAPELDWMCLVEFELFPGGGGGDEKAYEAADRAATRGAAVRKLAALVKDADSPLYEGDVACFVDRDFTAGLFGVEEAAPAKAEAPLSPDPAVAAVLARYDAARAPPSHAKPGCVPPPFGSGRSGARRDDVTFTVYVTYKGLRKPLQVLNPTKCRRVKCWVWPHDVLAALGLGRGVAGPWTAARALKPTTLGGRAVTAGAGQESEIPNFKGSYLGRFPLVSADFWTSDRLSERPRSVDPFFGTRAPGTLTLKRR